MKIMIKGTPKEIADFVAGAQSQQNKSTIHLDIKTVGIKHIKDIIKDFEQEFPNHVVTYKANS